MKELSELSRPSTAVIIPVSDARFLLASLQSILKQTVAPDEIILVFNGCEVPLLPAIERLSLKILISDEKLGPAAARNRGMEICKSDIILFQDADDLAYPFRVKESIEVLKTGRWGMLYGNVDICDESGEIYRRKDLDCSYSYALLQQQNIIPTGSVAIRKEVLAEVGHFNETMLLAEDYDLWLRIGKEYAIYQLEEAIYAYRDWSHSHTKLMKNKA